MKFRKLKIRNYRGVAESTVDFADSGITLVQGPNEAGKSSLAEAVGILFKYKSSSNHQDVRGIRPVHRDVGTEIELEAESGTYRFAYKKVYHRGKSTELRIDAPFRKNLTGDEAHDMAEKILAETLDKPLWDALTVRQGEGMGMPKIHGRSSLMAALDRAAGTGRADDDSEGVFERVKAEYARYYTATGKEGAELTKAARELEAAQEKERNLGNRLLDIEDKAERAATLRKGLSGMRLREEELKKRHDEYRTLSEAIAALTARLQEERLTQKTAEAAVETAKRDRQERSRLIDNIADLTAKTKKVESSLADSEPALTQAEEKLAEACQALSEAEQKEKTAGELAVLAANDCQYHNDRLHLEMLGELKARLDDANRIRAEAADTLTGTTITDKLLANIQKAELSVARLEAQLSAESPRLTLDAAAVCDLEIDAAPTRLESGERREYPVAGSLAITLPGQLSIRVEAGHGSDELAKQFKAAEEELARLCRTAGVDKPEDAAAALERRKAAENAVKAADELERSTLRGLSREELSTQLSRLAAEIPDYPRRRASLSPLPDDAEAARAVREEAERNRERAAGERDAAKRLHDAFKEEYDRLVAGRRDLSVELEVEEKRREQAQSVLAAALDIRDDAVLDAALDGTEKAVADAAAKVKASEDELGRMSPEQTRTMLATLATSFEAARNARGDAERELSGLSAELRVRGEDGLFEECQTARIEAEQALLLNKTLRAKAAAAALLRQTMLDARDRARRAYLAPLAGKIEELGRYVFNSTFKVELDENDLSLRSRTLDGVTVPFDSLSGGAKEQLSLIFRSACAIIVSEQEGMPLLLDDALGNTDSDRLIQMGAVLAKAAEQCQIVVFTCVPDRYLNLGGARVVRLERTRER